MVQSEQVVDACKDHRLPVFSDTPMPTLYGGAFGTGNGGGLPSESLAKIIYQVTIEGRTPGDISFPSVTDSSRLLYNQKHFHEQGVQLDDRTRRLIETQDVLTLWDENV